MNKKTLFSLIFLTFPLCTLADSGADYENMNDAMMHEKHHEPLHIHNESAHEKGSVDFAAADKNNDGKLTKKEAKTLSNVSKNFDQIDTDKDGTVDIDEVHIYMSNQNR